MLQRGTINTGPAANRTKDLRHFRAPRPWPRRVAVQLSVSMLEGTPDPPHYRRDECGAVRNG